MGKGTCRSNKTLWHGLGSKKTNSRDWVSLSSSGRAGGRRRRLARGLEQDDGVWRAEAEDNGWHAVGQDDADGWRAQEDYYGGWHAEDEDDGWRAVTEDDGDRDAWRVEEEDVETVTAGARRTEIAGAEETASGTGGRLSGRAGDRRRVRRPDGIWTRCAPARPTACTRANEPCVVAQPVRVTVLCVFW